MRLQVKVFLFIPLVVLWWQLRNFWRRSQQSTHTYYFVTIKALPKQLTRHQFSPPSWIQNLKPAYIRSRSIPGMSPLAVERHPLSVSQAPTGRSRVLQRNCSCRSGFPASPKSQIHHHHARPAVRGARQGIVPSHSRLSRRQANKEIIRRAITPPARRPTLRWLDFKPTPSRLSNMSDSNNSLLAWSYS